MICVKFFREKELFCGISVEGHAGYDVIGKDIVCSAVSALVQALEVGLRDVMKFTDSTVRTERNDAEGYMNISWAKESGIGDSVVFQTIMRSLWSIQKGYPKNIRIEEVYFDEDL
ncbi:MAG TPA: ribosomal-processing cysteine protease Prp [Synergistaceae bacterium]|nr:ribosomal-processing cysteine protease Prp [Synergistaceae bacterium]HPJ24807.1 ribosomal-processing cysteine protease Prp [Synergistaceae bacterium]HPQ36246.1 ribosomal-processing cysteine protease Prp [Synergistaceae bacterium]